MDTIWLIFLIVHVTVRLAINHLMDYHHVKSVVRAVAHAILIDTIAIILLTIMPQGQLFVAVYKVTSVHQVMILMVNVLVVLLVLRLSNYLLVRFFILKIILLIILTLTTTTTTIATSCRHCDIGWYSIDGLSASNCAQCPEGETTSGVGTALKCNQVP